MKFILKENLDTIHYTLFPSWDGSGEAEWEYEPSSVEWEIFVDSLVKQYPKETLEEILKEVLPEDYNDGTIEQQLQDIRDTVLDNLDLFDEDAYDYFYDNAVEQYEDNREYSRNPYAYNGVSPSDFY